MWRGHEVSVSPSAATDLFLRRGARFVRFALQGGTETLHEEGLRGSPSVRFRCFAFIGRCAFASEATVAATKTYTWFVS